jgi:hypothetical protein
MVVKDKQRIKKSVVDQVRMFKSSIFKCLTEAQAVNKGYGTTIKNGPGML